MSPVVCASGPRLTRRVSRLSLPKAVLQLAWRPAHAVPTLAVAGEDGTLRIVALDDDAYLQGEAAGE